MSIQSMSKRQLEGYRIFPYLAWSLVCGFAFFVYTLTVEIMNVQANLDSQVSQLKIHANQDPATITNFTR